MAGLEVGPAGFRAGDAAEGPAGGLVGGPEAGGGTVLWGWAAGWAAAWVDVLSLLTTIGNAV